jgi:hypothetical protein
MTAFPRPRRLPAAAVVLALVAALVTPAAARSDRSSAGLPPIRHVFVIVLENESYTTTFGSPAADPYLASTLPRRGVLLTNYYGTGHESNDNYIAMISGQGPNPQTQADCQIFANFVTAGVVVSPGQLVGSGCVYPTSVGTLGNQLTARHLTWKGYMGDMGNVASREAAVCGHPVLNSRDGTESAVPGDGYATRHDPFVYFHSNIDNTRYCAAHVVPLGMTNGKLPKGAPKGTTGLATDLKSARRTPNLSFIVPNLCDDGHDFPCTNQHSGASALADVDAFLSKWVPMITSSPAFRHDGLLIINFDESSQSDSTACCGEVAGPNSPRPGISGPGGGRTGAVLLSRFIDPGTKTSTPYNHYSLLASIEDLFHLPHLGFAATVTTKFGADVYNR